MDTVAKKLEQFFTQFKRYTYKKGTILLAPDTPPTGVFYLQKGVVKEYALTKDGEEVVINIFKAVSFFPLGWTINNTENKYFYAAMTDVNIWKAPKEHTVLLENADVLFNLLSRIFIGLEGVFSRLTYLMSGNAETRLITEILIYAKRFGYPTPEGSIEIKLSENDLAIQTGMKRETISRQITKLKEKNIIEKKQGVLRIKNLSVLEEALLML